MKNLPSLAGLMTFDSVARLGSFSKAALELCITQGAVSHRIAALENELGLKVLARTSRRVQLTEPGRLLFKATEEAFRRLRHGIAEIVAATNPSRVTVSCSPSFAICWLVPHLGDLRKAVPDIGVHLSVEDKLMEPDINGIDVSIRFGDGQFKGVKLEQLTDETVVAVCSPLYAESTPLQSLSDIAKCVLLHDNVLIEHRDHVGWREWLDNAGLPDVNDEQGLHFSHSHLAVSAAAAGQGIALARRSLVRQDLKYGRLVVPLENSIHSDLTYWLAIPKNRVPSPAVQAFCTWLKSALGAES